MITKEKLCEVLQYDETTGEFYRIKQTSYRRKVGIDNGTVNKYGYRLISFGSKQYSAHRLAWLMIYGEFPKLGIDHIDGNKLNNALSNLRLATKSGNSQNMGGCKSTNKLGLLGVTKHGKRYRATISINYTQMSLGSYDTPELAYAAYLNKKSEIHSYAVMDRLKSHHESKSLC